MQALLKDIKEKVLKEDFSAGLALCEQAIEINGGKTFSVYTTMATCALHMGNKAKALAAFESAISCGDASSPASTAQHQKVYKVYLEN